MGRAYCHNFLEKNFRCNATNEPTPIPPGYPLEILPEYAEHIGLGYGLDIGVYCTPGSRFILCAYMLRVY